jgi:hypothetical protein
VEQASSRKRDPEVPARFLFSFFLQLGLRERLSQAYAANVWSATVSTAAQVI